jgi:hypothetical protein
MCAFRLARRLPHDQIQTADRGYLLKQRRSGLDDLAVVATAMGAAAVGAFGVGASTIRWLAIGRVEAGNAKVVTLEVQDLAVTRPRVGDVVVTAALELPELDELPKNTS